MRNQSHSSCVQVVGSWTSYTEYPWKFGLSGSSSQSLLHWWDAMGWWGMCFHGLVISWTHDPGTVGFPFLSSLLFTYLILEHWFKNIYLTVFPLFVVQMSWAVLMDMDHMTRFHSIIHQTILTIWFFWDMVYSFNPCATGDVAICVKDYSVPS
jgi:hypothetical protein